MADKTPQQIARFIEENQYKMDLPMQYYGDEPNSYRKDWDSSTLKWLIFSCWPYEAAAGNQSIPLVYKTVNDWKPEYLADRFYLPASPRDMRTLERNGIPLFGIESRHQMRDFDVVGTSISYPVLVLSFVKQLYISDVPVRRKERYEQGAENFPMIICGGQAYGNPEFLSGVIDCFFCGEVEDEPGNPGLGAVNDRISAFKDSGLWSTDRVECYRELAREFNFLYFPEFLDVIYDYEDRSDVGLDKPSKQVMGYRSNVEGMRMPIVKRHVKDLNEVAALTNPPLLYVDPGMGAGDLEVGRGCPAWCSFCALTFRQKPYRQRDVAYMRNFATEMKRNVGSVHFSPFMPDFPMHTQRKRLIADLLENVNDEVDASSMRVDDFIADSDYIMLQVQGGMDHVTLGVEGNSQRMRDLVGKGCSDEDIKEAVARGMRAGITKFKLYMITNLPGEDAGDVFRVLKLAKELADIRDGMGKKNVRIQFSWTPLLIDPNTPFQWFAPPASSRLLGEIWEEMRALKMDFKLGGKAEPNKYAFFQLAARASRQQGDALVDVCLAIAKKQGSGFWGGIPKSIESLSGMSTEAALEAHLIDRGFLNGLGDAWDERFKQDMFGWEFIDQGISWEMLWVTYQQMREFVENTDSHTYDTNFGDDYHGNEWIERCDTKSLAGSTLVRLADGSQAQLQDLVGQTNWMASYDPETDRAVAAHSPEAWSNGVRKDMVRVRFEDGTDLHCSWDHLILTSNRGWIEALNLTSEDDVIVAEVPQRRELTTKQLERFWAHVEVVDSGCWESTYATNSSGYTYFYLGDSEGPQRLAMHTVAFETHVRMLDPGEEADHLCRNSKCCNPAHLQPLDRASNRGQANSGKTHCERDGHEYAEENTGVNKKYGSRYCKLCRAADQRARRALV